MNKTNLHKEALTFIQYKIEQLNHILQETLSATASEDSKSSAGDKHETAVSMAQLEQEKLTTQINEYIKLKAELKSLNPEHIHHTIQKGSLIETNNGWFYLSIGLGQVKTNDISFFCISQEAPLGKLLIGKTANQSIEFNGRTTNIITVY